MNLQGVEMLNLDNQFCYTSKQKKHLIKNKNERKTGSYSNLKGEKRQTSDMSLIQKWSHLVVSRCLGLK